MYPQQPDQQPQGFPPTPPQNSAVPPYPQQAPPQPQYQQPGYEQPYQQPQPQQMPQPQAAPVQQPSPWGQPAPQGGFPSQPQPQYQQTPSTLPQPSPSPSLAPDGMASIDYLNRIAAPQKRRFSLDNRQILIIGGILIIAMIGVLLLAIFRSSGPNMTTQAQHLVARTNALIEVTKKSQKSIKSRDLSVLNSGLTIQLTGAQTSLVEIFTNARINVNKIEKEILAVESNQKILDKFNDADLNSVFDRVYSREMSYELQNILITIKKFYNSTTDTKAKEQLESIYNTLEPLQKQLTEFNGAQS